MHTERPHNHENKYTDQGVGGGELRRNHWVANISNDNRPIKCKWEQSETSIGPEELVHKYTIRSNPGNPAEV
jgi:hypothetical protein